eukprot:UN24636
MKEPSKQRQRTLFYVGKKSLSEFYTKTNGNNWYDDSNWNSDKNLEKWYGITVEKDLITKIDLESNRLSGSLPSAFPSSLRYLFLSVNELTGSIPTEFPSFLREFYLDNNYLTGYIPTSLPSFLHILSLSENQLTGCI